VILDNTYEVKTQFDPGALVQKLSADHGGGMTNCRRIHSCQSSFGSPLTIATPFVIEIANRKDEQNLTIT
jgi:hypothetical protein